jgi:glycine hydroxymethyltransferase
MDFKRFREIADKIGAYLFVDMAHIAGLVAAGLHPNPVDYAHVVSTTTHKTLRGPRGGMILCKQEFAKKIDLEVFPGEQGGPLMHIIAAKAVALKEADTDGFKQYQSQIIKNAKSLAGALNKSGYRIVSGGTDNHLFLVDLTSKNITGRDTSELLDKIHITVNKNLIPFDKNSSGLASGIRLGTPAVTTRGMKETEMEKIARIITKAIKYRDCSGKLCECAKDVARLIKKFPLYPELTKS